MDAVTADDQPQEELGLDPALVAQIGQLVEARDLRGLRAILLSGLQPADIADLIGGFSDSDKAVIFRILPRPFAAEVFAYLDFEQQKTILSALGNERVAHILNEMPPDDRTALLEEVPASAAKQLLTLLSKEERAVALQLLGYPENSVGRLMTPDYIQVQRSWTVREVLDHIRHHARESDVIHVIFVVDEAGQLISEVLIQDVLLAPLERPIAELLKPSVVELRVTADQEEAVQSFKRYDRTVIPVVDADSVLLGIVTIDDVLDVAEEEATEDIQKLGAVEVLENPYIQVALGTLVRKRAGWLIILFVSEMLTATAMSFFENEIQRAVVLALFIPLIISSGGNSGSQAATLIIRALAIGEISLRDWSRVLRREIVAGVCLGLILGIIGFLRIAVWSQFADFYGPHWLMIAFSVSGALVAVVLWGALCGSMLPFILKRCGFDPATSSAPFVATLVDVTGLILYFTIASYILGGILL